LLLAGGYPVIFGMFVGFFIVGCFLVLPVQEPRRRHITEPKGLLSFE